MADNILIVYYSYSGNKETGGTLCAVQPETPYPAAYNTVVEQAKKEIQKGYHPKISTKIDNLKIYDTIFVGSPNWWSTIAPPIAAFLSENDLS
jgi:flavodoxin